MGATTVDELNLKINGDSSKLQKAAKSASLSIKSMTIAMGAANIATGILKKTIDVASQHIDDAIKRVDTINNFSNTMANLGSSAIDSQQSIARLSEKLQGLPTKLDDAVASVQRFTSTNGNVKASTEMFLALNNAIVAGGGSAEIQASALEQISQAYAKGKPDIAEWRTLLMAMPAQLKQVAQAMGYVSSNDLGEALRSGKVSMDDFMLTLIKLNKEGINGLASFEEQASTASGGIQTSIANCKNAITRGVAEILNTIGQANIANFFNGIRNAINAVIPYISAFVKVCMQAVSYISVLFGGKGLSSSNSGIKSLTNAVDNTSNVLTGMGTSAEDASDGIDKTTGSAKKLKKELLGLAGFDEMTVLKEQNNSDSGSGSTTVGSVGGGAIGSLNDIDFSDWSTELENTSSKADKIAEKMKSVFSTIWNSEPVKAYVNLIKTKLGFMRDFAVQIGTDLSNNITMTWSNIEGNVSTIFTNISTLLTTAWTDMANGIETWGQPIIDGVSGLFNSIWQDAIDPYIQVIIKEWADFSKILVDLWNKHSKPLIDNVGEMVTKVIALFQSIWDKVLVPIITPFLEMLSDLWENHLKGMIQEVGDFIGELINGAVEIYNKFIDPIVIWLLDKLSPVFVYLGKVISDVFGTVAIVISDVVTEIIRVFKGIVEFIVGVFTGNWAKAWQGVKDIFGDIITGIANIFRAPINSIIDGINGFITGLNKIKIPDWVPAVGGKGFNISKIQRLGRGGVVDKPIYAQIGEAGKEVVMPLENNTGWIDELAQKLNEKGGNSNQPIQVIVQIGDDEITNKIVKNIQDKDFTMNGGFLW